MVRALMSPRRTRHCLQLVSNRNLTTGDGIGKLPRAIESGALVFRAISGAILCALTLIVMVACASHSALTAAPVAPTASAAISTPPPVSSENASALAAESRAAASSSSAWAAAAKAAAAQAAAARAAVAKAAAAKAAAEKAAAERAAAAKAAADRAAAAQAPAAPASAPRGPRLHPLPQPRVPLDIAPVSRLARTSIARAVPAMALDTSKGQSLLPEAIPMDSTVTTTESGVRSRS